MKQLMLIPNLKQINKSEELAKEYGCAFEYNDFILGSVLDDEAACAELVGKVRSRGSNANSTMHGVFFDIAVFSADPAIRAVSERRVHQSMDIASKTELGGVVFHTNYIPTFCVKEYQDWWVEANKRFFTNVSQEYANINIYMENMFDLEPELLRRLADEMQGIKNFGVCLDIAHANLSDIAIERWIECLAPYIKHLHINDNDGKTDGHLPLGEGIIDFKSVFGSIERHCADASVLIEVSGVLSQQRCLDYLKQNKFI